MNQTTKFEKMAKNLFSGPMLAPLAQIRDINFFSSQKNLTSSVTRYPGQLSYVQYQKKLIIQS